MPQALEVERLSVRFAGSPVLRDVSFEVPDGGSLAVIGPNGAGKTILFKALIGSIPFEGAVRWRPGSRVGYVPQRLDIERDLPITGTDLLRAKAGVAGVSLDEALKAAGRVGLPSSLLGRLLIGSMSGGQFQRLLIALALIGEPNVLLFDEPAAGIDEPGQEQIMGLVHGLHQEGITVLFISHDLSVVSQCAEAVLCLSRRTPAFFGPPQQVLTPEALTELYGAPIGFHDHRSPRP